MEITGALTADGTDLVLVRHVPAARAEIWRHLTESERLAAWFGTYTGDPASGTVQVTMTAEPGDAVASDYTIHACAPQELLTVSSAAGEGTWRLSLELEDAAGGADGDAPAGSAGGGTRVALRHHDVPREMVEHIGPGWEWYLDRLIGVATGGDVPGMDVWDAQYMSLAPAYAELAAGERTGD
ncbi:SRPBCC domain-containing protein [Brachybacterium sp. J144]|uniref:SRPBCC domain-containing protein n=1 Tax=Brachybacterium sp. J144 TaxID=3116487 RepID=UPI002E76D51E|nr:SRPBCC domain-containing protein [Brachybacterium sp. J144]MEE1650220.1 SRPBCC domain-containing protein [Brachybacterium sp. J144]